VIRQVRNCEQTLIRLRPPINRLVCRGAEGNLVSCPQRSPHSAADFGDKQATENKALVARGWNSPDMANSKFGTIAATTMRAMSIANRATSGGPCPDYVGTRLCATVHVSIRSMHVRHGPPVGNLWWAGANGGAMQTRNRRSGSRDWDRYWLPDTRNSSLSASFLKRQSMPWMPTSPPAASYSRNVMSPS
jgi:hypothetical protein